MKKFLLLCCLVVVSLDAAALDCVYPDKSHAAMVQAENCGEFEADGEFRIASDILSRVEFSEALPACIILFSDSKSHQAIYLNQQGEVRTTLFFDNGCDYFEEGLARTRYNGKAAYFDKNLELVIETNFEQSAPFSYGHAMVCNGPFIEEQHGEHQLQRGGRCGLIDRAGKLVVPAEYRIEQNDVFTRYINTHNECEPPPITTRADALCHAKRHALALDYHSDDWSWYRVSEKNDRWQVDFVQTQEPDTALTMAVNRESAHWISIVPMDEARE